MQKLRVCDQSKQKLTAFNKVTKVLDSQVYSEQFSIERTVPRLCRAQLPGEVCDRTPAVIDVLL